MSSTPQSAPPPPAPGRPWGAGRIVLLVLGAILALVSLGLLAGGCATLALESERDAEGFLSTRSATFESDGYALLSERIDIDEETPGWVLSDSVLGEIRLRAEATGGGDVFLGVGPADDVAAYLDGVSHSQVTDVHFDPFRPEYREVAGGAPAGPPGEEPFWATTAAGPGEQTLTWEPERGDWSLVVMNADAAEGVEADISIGAKAGFLGWVAAGLLIAGVVLLGVAGLLLFLALRSGGPPAPAYAYAPGAPGAPAAYAAAAPPYVAADYPVGLRGDLDPGLGRWLWLVKWILVIPHAIVLWFLWLVLWILTIVAFFAILFTGRYPRGIFDFNVGVLRWTWRVSFYSYWANGTDRYPPFSLDPRPDYPADFHVEYPERLSRGLIFVKWLLAIPHYIVVGILVGGLGFGWGWAAWGDDWENAGGWPGLVLLLVLIAAVYLLFTGRYLRGIFDLVLGFDRWAFRVAPYVLLMRDEYPPFRLDSGPREPGDEEAAATTEEPAPA